MDRYEKERYLENFCDSVDDCAFCPLNIRGWKDPIASIGRTRCLSIKTSPVEDLDKAIKIVEAVRC